MKIAFLADRRSIHTVRWVNALAERGHEVHLISNIHTGEPLHRAVQFHRLPIPPPAGYFLNAPTLKSLLRSIDPAILNTHYASGYGTLARLSGFRPNVLSVWGSDVYEFPYRSPVHRRLLIANALQADWVCSTSAAMAAQLRQLCAPKRLSVVPFGIDTATFTPRVRPAPSATFTVGTVKALSEKYGIDLLLKAFAQLKHELLSEQPTLADTLRLLIVGGGPLERELKALTASLGISESTRFVGAVPHEKVPGYLQQLDVYLALSRFESFGVAALEASACGLPVIVSDAGGLPEVVLDGEAGIVVAREDVGAATRALKTLVSDASLRKRLGQAGRVHVEARYRWDVCIERMETVYEKVLACKT